MPLVRNLGSALWEVRSALPTRIARTYFSSMKEKSFFFMGSLRKPEKLHLKTEYWLCSENAYLKTSTARSGEHFCYSRYSQSCCSIARPEGQNRVGSGIDSAATLRLFAGVTLQRFNGSTSAKRNVKKYIDATPFHPQRQFQRIEQGRLEGFARRQCVYLILQPNKNKFVR
jgi:hypothetical protein